MSDFYMPLNYQGQKIMPDFTGVKSFASLSMFEAFYDCPTIVGELTFPSLTTVEDYGLQMAFPYCPNITKVTFNELTTLKSNSLTSTFYGCTGLKEAYFPKLVTLTNNSLSYIFNECTSLEKIHFKSSMSGSSYIKQSIMQCPETTEILFDL